MDTVFLHGIKTDLVVGVDAWHRHGKPQPVVINVELVPVETLESAALEDNVAMTLDYVKSSSIEISLPKATLLAEGGISVTRKTLVAEDTGPAVYQRLVLNRIPCSCIIGVNPHERIDKQRLILTISTEGIQTPLSTAVVAGVSLDSSTSPAWLDAVKEVVERVNNSAYLTVETLATAIAQVVTMNHGFESATVRIEKPSAISTIDAAGVQITRTKAFFENKDFWKVKRP